MIFDFLNAALPWIGMGLLVACFAAGYNEKENNV